MQITVYYYFMKTKNVFMVIIFNFILNIYNNGIATNNAFKLFWNNKINNEVNDELEVSEF